MKKRDFETYQKRLRDFEILPKFSETHVFRGTIRHPFQKCIKIQFFELMHTNLLVIGNRGSENRRNILEIKITMLKRVKKFCDPRWSCNLSNTTIRRHCTPCAIAFQRTSPQSLSDRRKIVG